MPGPKKTPTAILTNRGSWRAKTRPNEPKPKRGIPPKPKWLEKAAVPYWEEISTYLDDIGVLAIGDGVALALLVNTMARLIDIEKTLNKEGMFYHNPETGAYLVHPGMRAHNNLLGHMTRMLSQFGLTPSARASVETLPEGRIIGDKEELFSIS